jgi:phosphatidylglycerophosphate synthase
MRSRSTLSLVTSRQPLLRRRTDSRASIIRVPLGRQRAERASTTEALLFATTPGPENDPAALLPAGRAALIDRLLEQLRELDVRRAWIVTRPAWQAGLEAAVTRSELNATVLTADDASDDFRAAAEVAERAEGALAVLHAHSLTHREALVGLLSDPRITSGALITRFPSEGLSWHEVRFARNRLVSAASPYHYVTRPTGRFLGSLKVGHRERTQLAAVARRLAELASEPRPEPWNVELGRKADEWRLVLRQSANGREAEAALSHRVRAAQDDPVSLLLVGLVRADIEVSPVDLRGFFHASPVTPSEAAEASERLAGKDEERLLLDSAVKSSDGFFTTFFVSPYSKYLARFAARQGWTPNAVTAISLVLGTVAAGSFAFGSRWSLVLGAVLLQVSFTVDCVDGQLARLTRTYSSFGGWLDSVSDRTKEYLVYAGLAFGSVRGFDDDVWLLAAAALTVQVFRHLADFSYSVSVGDTVGSLPRAPLEQAEDLPPSHIDETRERPLEERVAAAAESGGTRALGSNVVARVHRLRRSDVARWLNRIIRLPIGERFALISITAAIATPRTTFVALLVWGGVAALYAFAGRLVMAYSVTGRIVRALLR